MKKRKNTKSQGFQPEDPAARAQTRKPRPGAARASNTPADADWRSRDPAAATEATRYAHPLPSRVLIQQTIAESERAPTLDDLIGHFALNKLSEQEALGKRVLAMLRDEQIAVDAFGAYRVPDNAPTAVPKPDTRVVEGRVSAHRDGYGFVALDGGGSDVFLPPRHMRGVMDGDRLRVRVTNEDERGRREGVLVQIIERSRRTLVGRLHLQQGVCTVIPSSPKLPEVVVPPANRGGAEAGQVVVVELLSPPNDRALPVGRVIEVLGAHMAPGLEIESAIRTHNLPCEWPAAVEHEAAAYAPEVQPEQYAGRVDLRDLGLMTIDGADARDFDDAVCAERVRGGKGGWKLWVAIADVSAYVTPDSALDEEAKRRGNSVYFPQRVIPMLPEALSNGLCSLNPEVERLCMVCELRVASDGSVLKSRFYEAVMRSQARLIYEDVAEILNDPQGPTAAMRPELITPLQTLQDVFEALFAARETRGAIDFEGGETRIVFSAERKIEKIVPVKRTIAHRLIEECMIAANVEAARLVDKHKMPALYRVHAEPDADKIALLREFLAGRALRLAGGAQPSAKDFAHTIKQLKDRPDAGHVQNVMLRALMQARYSADNSGHFGLALTHYAHFTSPIRRYPDLLLHRAIKHVLLRGRVKSFTYTQAQLEALGAHCSMTERRADEATRDAVTWLKCEFMQSRVGEELGGVVTSCASFGLFVELDGLYVDGLIHVSTLGDDYYEFDARHQRLSGARNKRVYALGDRLRVRVARVSLDERKIDLALVRREEESYGKRKTGKNGKAEPRADGERHPAARAPRHDEAAATTDRADPRGHGKKARKTGAPPQGAARSKAAQTDAAPGAARKKTAKKPKAAGHKTGKTGKKAPRGAANGQNTRSSRSRKRR